MSHLTLVTTRIKNFKVLKKSLNDLNLSWSTDTNRINPVEFDLSDLDLVVHDNNNNFLFGFSWNGTEYNLATDLSYWSLPCSSDKFMQKLNQQYATNIIIETTAKKGFKPMHQNIKDSGVVQLICERWDV